VVEYEALGITTPELRESYELCADLNNRFFGPMWTASAVLPATVRPHFSALTGFSVWTDSIADDIERADREQVLAQWCENTLTDVRAGHSEHPLRRAFVHTVRLWDIETTVIKEFLTATQADCAAPPAFATAADQRHYLRGVAGTFGEMVTPLLQPRTQQAARLMSVLCETAQLLDILQDFPTDMATGRCYLPREDLRRLDLEVDDLQCGKRHDALNELVALQVTRARDLLVQAAPVAGTVSVPCQPFLHTLILGLEFQLDVVERLRSQVLTDGIDTAELTNIGLRPHREPSAAPVPTHVAVIMDGNRRWAASRGLTASEGHSAGERAAMRLIHSALRLGIAQLSVFAFSTENWNRPPEEITHLFDTMAEGITRATEWMHERGVRLRWCGRRDRLEQSVASQLAIVESLTSNNTRLTLNIFVDYGGRDEMVAAARALATEVAAGTIRPEDIGPDDLTRNLCAPDLPDVDLLIRTSGEQRVSNFLPWHLAYAEFVFEPANWPDFGYHHLLAAITEYTSRQRRFGGDNHDRPTATTRTVEPIAG
jgi:undecaprenyl diphosphate synthase